MFFFVFLCFRCFPRACGQVFPPISPIKWGEIISIYIFLIAYMILVIWENRGNREKSQCFRGFAAFLLLGENWHKGQKPPISAAFVALPDSVALLSSLRGYIDGVYILSSVPDGRVCCRHFYFVKQTRQTGGGGVAGSDKTFIGPSHTPKNQPDEYDENSIYIFCLTFV